MAGFHFRSRSASSHRHCCSHYRPLINYRYHGDEFYNRENDLRIIKDRISGKSEDGAPDDGEAKVLVLDWDLLALESDLARGLRLLLADITDDGLREDI